MTREEVQERLDAFMVLLDQEQILKEELLALRLYGRRATEDEVGEQLARHDELIREIERLRSEDMLPLLEEVAAFVSSQRLDHVEPT